MTFGENGGGWGGSGDCEFEMKEGGFVENIT